MRDVLLVSGIICASGLITALIVWRFIVGRSLRKAVMMVLGIWMQKTNPDIEALKSAAAQPEPDRSDKLVAQAEALKAESPTGATPPRERASIPAHETGEQATTTSFNGWPRALNRSVRAIRRPFRKIRLETESDDIMLTDQQDMHSKD